MKKVIAILVCLILALGVSFFLPEFIQTSNDANADIENEVSLVKQEILSYSTIENEYDKLYCDGRLIGVVSNLDNLYSLIASKYSEYEKEFPDTQLGLSNSCFIVKEKSYANFENIDEGIFDYLVNHNLLGIKTNAIEFSTNSGVYEIIYVKSVDDFYEARDQFLLNFISETTLSKLRRNEAIATPNELGTVEKSLAMLETIQVGDAIVNPNVIFKDTNEIYDFLCYGRNDKRDYYTVKEGDTLQGVGYNFSDMSPKQLVMINPEILSSVDQIVTPGMKLNVTYYTSPITIQVTKENLTQEYITPETPEYIEDDTLEAGTTKVLVQEERGIKNVLYKEVWLNGILQTGEKQSENVIKQAVRGQIAVGTKIVNMVGTGNYVWPVDNPYITCRWGCYLNHTGTDFINKYDRYGPIYAIDSGVVTKVGYNEATTGNYCTIDHQNGVVTSYMHMYTRPYVEEGDNVARGQIIGKIGNTGDSSGAHLHLLFIVNGERQDACHYLPCDLISIR